MMDTGVFVEVNQQYQYVLPIHCQKTLMEFLNEYGQRVNVSPNVGCVNKLSDYDKRKFDGSPSRNNAIRNFRK